MRFQLPWSRQGRSSHTQSAKAETPTAACARTGAQDVQNGFDRGWQAGVARPPQRGIGGELDRECLPLRLAQPRGIGWGVASMACPPLASVGQPTPWKLPDFSNTLLISIEMQDLKIWLRHSENLDLAWSKFDLFLE